VTKREIYNAEISALKQVIENQKKRIQRRDDLIAELKGDLESTRVELEMTHRRLEHATQLTTYIENNYSEKQIEVIRHGKRVHWTALDISNAIGIYSVSSRAYVYLRDVLNYALPHKSSLRWISKINLKPGLLEPVFNLIRVTFQNSTPSERASILGFDEMSIDQRYCYDSTLDRVYGNEKLMAGIVCGLCSNWKQLIHYDFGYKMTKESLLTMIEKLHYSNSDVRGIVCDLGKFQISIELELRKLFRCN